MGGPVPFEPSFRAACEETGFRPYKLPTCPAKYLWKATSTLVSHPLFIECVIRETVSFYGQGMVNEPSSWMQFVRYARGELEGFQQTVSVAQAKKKRPAK